jgi:hypothetical protein
VASARTQKTKPILRSAKIESDGAPGLLVKVGSEYAPSAQQGQQQQEPEAGRGSGRSKKKSQAAPQKHSPPPDDAQSILCFAKP